MKQERHGEEMTFSYQFDPCRLQQDPERQKTLMNKAVTRGGVFWVLKHPPPPKLFAFF